MKKRIYVTDNFPFPEMLGNIESVCHERGFELIKTDEKTCREHLLLNRASLALLSPLGYGLGVKSADYRIIPTYTVGLVGYTGKASLYFNSGLSTLDKIGSCYPEDFMMIIGQILLSERYEIDAEIEFAKGNTDELLKKYSSVMAYGNSENPNSMDISEDWFESFEIPLILGFWVARNEEEPEDVVELTKLFAVDDLPEEIEICAEHEREGKILTKWNSEIKSSLEQTLEFLYYHNLLPEIPAVKIYGMD